MRFKSENFSLAIISGIICLVVFALLFQVWRVDFSVPFFRYNNDFLFYSFVVKNIVDYGWISSNPSVGLPNISSIYSLNDHPQHSEFINLILVKFLNLFTDNIFLICNTFLLSSFFLISVFCFIGLRIYGISTFVSIIIAVLYAFIPYHFERNTWHLFLSNYSIIPLVSITMLWFYEEKIKMIYLNINKQLSLKPNKYFYISLLIIILASFNGIYYSCYAIIFLGLALVLSSIKKGSFFNQNLAIFLFFLFLNILLTFCINLPSIIDLMKNNFESLPDRSSVASYFFGLKLINLFLPIENHFIEYFAKLKIYFNEVIDIEQENRASSLGLLGATGFLFSIFWLLLRSNNVESLYMRTIKKFFLKDNDCEKISFLASLNLLAILFFSAGGGLIIFVSILFPALRSNARSVVFIAFFSLTIIAIIFDKIIEHKFFKSTSNAKIFIILISFLALLDQVGKSSHLILQPTETVKNFNNDKDFIEEIEKSLPINSSIFILPIYNFPEASGDEYQGVIAYLHSKNLGFSYPVNKGSKSLKWQRKVFLQSSFKNFINELRSKNFSGIYLDRDAYINFFNVNKGKIIDRNVLENEMKKYSLSAPIFSRDKRLMFVKI